ncbi:MAG: tetratricopeptide repeat protein [Leptolyngbya sp. SIO3F4]|nr:tetratricopeptide repeat protein [Leptolyngbya sp. SIO3F4]
MCAQDKGEDMGRLHQRLGWLAGLWVLALPMGNNAQAVSERYDFSSPVPRQLASHTIAQVTSETERAAEANHFFSQGTQQYRQSEFREALTSWQRALELYQEATLSERNWLDQADTLTSIGKVYDVLGQYELSIDFHNQALDIYRDNDLHTALPLESRVGEASVLIGLGNVYNTLSQYERAIAFQEEALGVYQEGARHPLADEK